MPFVLDASVTACWAFQDEDHPLAGLALDRLTTDDAIVPALWWFEVRNILVVNERRGRVSESVTRAFLRHLASLPVRVDSAPDEDEVLRLARAHRLSVYDAAYLELALRQGCPLASLDRELVAAAAAVRVTPLA
jgi:predicted nucleic acid-binding protein